MRDEVTARASEITFGEARDDCVTRTKGVDFRVKLYEEVLHIYINLSLYSLLSVYREVESI